MGRYARQTITDVPYHVINRGNNHQPIFFNDDDYCFFLEKQYKRSGTLWEGRFKSSPVSSDRYLLLCSRYSEMNPVRAGIVERPDDYVFSSYGAKVGLRELTYLDYDSFYNSLGNTINERQRAYQRWFCESIPKAEWDLIREAVQRNWAYGNNRFKEQMETALDRKFELKQAGRKPKM